MKIVNDATCSNCRFFRPSMNGRGDCRRYPPTIVNAMFERMDDCEKEVFAMTRWPITYGDEEWCGEWLSPCK